MFGFSLGEILVLAAIGLIVIGPKQLPELAHQLGKIMNYVRRSTNDFLYEFKQSAIDEEYKKSIKPKTDDAKPEDKKNV